MLDIVRDSTFGYLVNQASGGRILPYADQRKDYVIPPRYLASDDKTLSVCSTGNVTLVNGGTPPQKAQNAFEDEEKRTGLETLGEADSKKVVALPPQYLVDWEENDSDNPRNWSKGKRLFVAFEIAFLTYSVYYASAAYTPSIPGLMEEFGVSLVLATLGLTLFVMAYGFGPMLMSPLQEVPAIGRTTPYIVGLALFVIFQVPPIFAKNIGTVLVSRTIAGFVGSPALATGGASMGDIFPPMAMPYAIAVWALGAVFGPVSGPVAAGFAAMAKSWRWPFLEMLWISGFSAIMLFFFLPETMASTILLRRAQRLRKLTGNPLLRSQSEIDAQNGSSVASEIGHNIIKAFKLSMEPAIGFANIYIGFVYALFYLWFESFPLVFTDIYHFNLGVSGLPFLGFIVSGAITLTAYICYQKYHMIPRYQRNPDTPPEARLELAIVAALFIPVAMLMFGWTARASVHWIVPIIAAALYLPGIFLIFQSLLLYIGIGYPKHVASVFAGNTLFRSVIASVFPLFGRDLFVNLGLGGGSSLLAGIALLMVPLLYLLLKFGARLRARSKWTDN